MRTLTYLAMMIAVCGCKERQDRSELAGNFAASYEGNVYYYYPSKVLYEARLPDGKSKAQRLLCRRSCSKLYVDKSGKPTEENTRNTFDVALENQAKQAKEAIKA